MSTRLPVLIVRRLIVLTIVAALVIAAVIIIGSHQHNLSIAQPVADASTDPYDGLSAVQERLDLQRLRASRTRATALAKATPVPTPKSIHQPTHKSVKPKVVVHHYVSTNLSGIAPVWVALVQCEAGGRWRYGAPGVGIDRGYDFEGGPNFTHGTWVGAGGRQFAEHAYDATPAEQVIVAKRVLRSQGVGAWPECGPKVGLTRADAN